MKDLSSRGAPTLQIMSETPAEDGDASGAVTRSPQPSRVKNYKSIAQCDVRLGPLTILVGPNGSE